MIDLPPVGLPNSCPYCGTTPCLPLWRKLTLGPLGYAHCRTCGFRVMADTIRATVALIPATLVLVLALVGVMTDFVTIVALLLVFYGLSLILYLEWVGLFPASISNPRWVAEEKARIAAEREQKAERPRNRWGRSSVDH